MVPGRRISAWLHQPRPGDRERSSSHPTHCQPLYLDIPQPGQVRGDIISDAIHGSVKRQAKAEEDTEDEVGEQGSEPDSFAKGLDTFDQYSEHNQPG